MNIVCMTWCIYISTTWQSNLFIVIVIVIAKPLRINLSDIWMKEHGKNAFWKGHQPNGDRFASASLCCVNIPVSQASHIYVRFMSRQSHVQFWQINRLFSERRITLLVCWGLLSSFKRDFSAVFKTERFRTYFRSANVVFPGIRGLKWYLNLCQKLDFFHQPDQVNKEENISARKTGPLWAGPSWPHKGRAKRKAFP